MGVPRRWLIFYCEQESSSLPVTLSYMKKEGLIGHNTETVWLTNRGREKATRKYLGDSKKIINYIRLHEILGKPMAKIKLLAFCEQDINTLPVMLSYMKKEHLIRDNTETVWLTRKGRAKSNFGTRQENFDNIAAQEDIKERYNIEGEAEVLFDILRDGKAHDLQSVRGSLGPKHKNSAGRALSSLNQNGVIEFQCNSTAKVSAWKPRQRQHQQQRLSNNMSASSFQRMDKEIGDSRPSATSRPCVRITVRLSDSCFPFGRPGESVESTDVSVLTETAEEPTH